jgi:hypothetical protein
MSCGICGLIYTGYDKCPQCLGDADGWYTHLASITVREQNKAKRLATIDEMMRMLSVLRESIEAEK